MCAYHAGRPWGGTRREWLSETGRSDNEPRRPAAEWRREKKRGMRKTMATLTLSVTPDPGPLCTLSARLSGRFVRPPYSMATPLTDTLYILWVWRNQERGRGRHANYMRDVSKGCFSAIPSFSQQLVASSNFPNRSFVSYEKTPNPSWILLVQTQTSLRN